MPNAMPYPARHVEIKPLRAPTVFDDRRVDPAAQSLHCYRSAPRHGDPTHQGRTHAETMTREATERRHYALRLAWSTRTPIPIVLDTLIFFR